MASHVAEGAGAEVPPAAPSERLIGMVIRPRRSRAEEQIPMRCRRDRLFGRLGHHLRSLRPDRTVGPDMDLAHRADRAGTNDFNAAAKLVLGGSLIAHLRGDFVLAGGHSHRRASATVCVIGFWQ